MKLDNTPVLTARDPPSAQREGRPPVAVVAPTSGRATPLISLGIFALAFLAFASLLLVEPRALFLPLGAGLVGTVFGATLFRVSGATPQRMVLFAGVTGLLLAELGWAVSYWSSAGLVAAAFLWISFYVAAGAIQAHLQGIPGLRLAVEYTVVGLVGLAIVLSAQPWRG